MFEMIVMVNTTENSAYASGNKQFFGLNKADLFKVIINPATHGNNENFLKWAKRFKSVNELHFQFVSSNTQGNAKTESIKCMSTNKWTEISLFTVEKES